MSFYKRLRGIVVTAVVTSGVYCIRAIESGLANSNGLPGSSTCNVPAPSSRPARSSQTPSPTFCDNDLDTTDDDVKSKFLLKTRFCSLSANQGPLSSAKVTASPSWTRLSLKSSLEIVLSTIPASPRPLPSLLLNFSRTSAEALSPTPFFTLARYCLRSVPPFPPGPLSQAFASIRSPRILSQKILPVRTLLPRPIIVSGTLRRIHRIRL